MIVPQSPGNPGSMQIGGGRTTRLALASLFSAALVVVSMGGPVAAQDASDAPTDDVQSLLEGLDFGSGAAAVILADQRYDFGSATETSESRTYLGVCQEVFGVVAANLNLTDGREITVDMQIPPVDWDTYDDGRYDPPKIEVSIEDPYQVWIADAGWAAANSLDGQSQVDAFERDGSSATGTATFVEQLSVLQGQPSEPVRGTFEVRCVEE